MKKVIHAIAVYGPIGLLGITVLFLLPLVFSWSFIPNNGYVWCGVSTALFLLVSICVKSDYTGRTLPKIEENGILLLATSNTAWWIYVWSTVEYTLIMPFALICVAVAMYLMVKLCDDSVKRTLGIMAGSAIAIVGVIIWLLPLLSPAKQVKDRFNVYNEHSVVAKVTVVRDAGNVYNISVVAKKTGLNLGIGRFENNNEANAYYKVVDVADYQKPTVSWQGADLYINGVIQPIYWK